jgi:predicted GTPase
LAGGTNRSSSCAARATGGTRNIPAQQRTPSEKFRFVAEEPNPKNHLGVERVELFYPADILANGTVLIDTPGVGSTIKHNTQAAMQVLPECDAAFFVLSADPPITEIELDYLLRLKAKTARVFFILNKADSLAPDEQGAAIEFLHKVLGEHELIGTSEPIFCISARRGLVAKREGNNEILESSAIESTPDCTSMPSARAV